uniref:ETS domain-containing protein n=1 Tax=Strongyloides stercoralis TaxID=6248 RepID=A0A0K0E1P3_STRER
MRSVYEYHHPDSDDVFESKLLFAMKEDGRVDFNVRNLPDVCEKCSITVNYWKYMTKSSPNGKHWSYHIERMIKKGFLRARKYKGGNPIEFSVISSDCKPKQAEKQQQQPPEGSSRKLSTLFMEQLFHILLLTNLEIINVDSIPSHCKNNNVSLDYWTTTRGNKGILKQYLKCMETKNMLQIIELDKYKFPLKIKLNRGRESVIRHIENMDDNNSNERGNENHRKAFNSSRINSSLSSYDNTYYPNTTYDKNDDVFISNDMAKNNESFPSYNTPPNNTESMLQNNNVFASINSLGLLEDYNFENELEPFDERPFINNYLHSISSDYNSLYNNSSLVDVITPLDFKCNLLNCMEKGTFYTIESLQDTYRCYYGSELTTTLVNEIFHTKYPSLDIAIYSNINCIMLKKSDNGTVSICRF